MNPQQKLNLLDRALQQAPDLALLHLLHGKSLQSLRQTAAAQVAYRRGLECVEEPDTKTRLLVNLAAVVENAEEEKRLLEEAISLNGNLVAAAMARVVLAYE